MIEKFRGQIHTSERGQDIDNERRKSREDQRCTRGLDHQTCRDRDCSLRHIVDIHQSVSWATSFEGEGR
jgi:hypothetical protein